MELKLVNSEINQVINALDTYSRIWIGQYDHILFEIRWYRDCKILDAVEDRCKQYLFNIRKILIPELNGYGFYASHGIFSLEVNFKSAVAYNLQQVIRYKRAWFENPEGGITIDFGSPLKAELDPYEWPQASCEKNEDGKTVETITLEKEQLEIIRDSLIIRYAMLNGDIHTVFSHYTDDAEVLGFAEVISKLLQSAKEEWPTDYPRELIAKIDEVLKCNK